MKNFDIRRFCVVARWDLTINRAFYNKMAMAIAACSILPVLFVAPLASLMDYWGAIKDDLLPIFPS
mgnify:CR=1 FL=1